MFVTPSDSAPSGISGDCSTVQSSSLNASSETVSSWPGIPPEMRPSSVTLTGSASVEFSDSVVAPSGV